LGSNAEAVSLQHRFLLQTSTRELLQLFKVGKQRAAIQVRFVIARSRSTHAEPHSQAVFTFK